MGYYYQHNFIFAYHGIQRLKERLNLKKLQDYQIKEQVIKMIEDTYDIVVTSKHHYIGIENLKINGGKIYVVVDRRSNTIITATPISDSKMLSIIDNDL